MLRSSLRLYGALGCAAVIVGVSAATVSAQRQRPRARMADAAKAFLATLEPAQRQKAVYPFNSEERFNWHFIPKTRNGLPLKEMTEPQRKAALSLLAAGLSEQGLMKANTIRELEKILKQVEMGRGPVRDPEQYFFTVFGEPSTDGTWGWRYEGHHCALNWTLVSGKPVVGSPQFFGSNPGEVRVEVPQAPPKGTRVLRGEEDLARALVKNLNEAQRGKAILSATAPPDIITGAQRQAAIQEDKGVAYGELSADQQGMLMQVIQEYTGAMPRGLAAQRLQKIRGAGLDKVKFAWMGSIEPNQGHYYRVQGPTFLIEYDNTQNNANHVHAVWRDFKSDFGMDLLAMHYQATPHRVARAK
jgi:hypothetical protein